MSAVKAHTSKILNWLQNERKIDTYVKKNLLQPDFCPQVFFYCDFSGLPTLPHIRRDFRIQHSDILLNDISVDTRLPHFTLSYSHVPFLLCVSPQTPSASSWLELVSFPEASAAGLCV